MTSCPNSFINRLTHGECVPVSSATRLCGIAPNTSLSAFGVVLTLPSKTTSPRSSNTQYQLQRSPRSNPTVYFFPAKLLACCLATVILFVIAGLLLYCASSALSLGGYRIPPRDRHSHPIWLRQSSWRLAKIQRKVSKRKAMAIPLSVVPDGRRALSADWIRLCGLLLLVLSLGSCDRNSYLRPFGYDRASLLKRYTPQDDES